MLASRARGRSRAYLMTGSSPAEGKTTSAIGLAAALAHGGSRVILIEADLRRPTIAQTLDLELEYGTEDVILGRVELPEALTVAEFDGWALRVLAVRRPGAGHADRLSPSVARRLITEARSMADFVVIDSPPLTDVSDALPLANLADEVLIVARMGVSKLGKLARLHDMLVSQGTRPSGLVLVGETGPRTGYYYSAAVENGEVTPMRRGDRPADSEESVGTPRA
jgi:receptor protein-tyrosine kinase